MTGAQEQLAEELQEAVVAPLGELLGSGAGFELEDCLRGAQSSLGAAMARGDTRGQLVASLVVDLLWRGHVPPEWWSTSLGLLVGGLLEDVPITQFEAAAILGVQQGTISKLLARGFLARSDRPRPADWMGPKAALPVSRASVLSRLARLKTGANSEVRW
jgi:hypothetical protein